jgi:hypothetical protein
VEVNVSVQGLFFELADEEAKQHQVSTGMLLLQQPVDSADLPVV